MSPCKILGKVCQAYSKQSINLTTYILPWLSAQSHSWNIENAQKMVTQWIQCLDFLGRALMGKDRYILFCEKGNTARDGDEGSICPPNHLSFLRTLLTCKKCSPLIGSLVHIALQSLWYLFFLSCLLTNWIFSSTRMGWYLLIPTSST